MSVLLELKGGIDIVRGSPIINKIEHFFNKHKTEKFLLLEGFPGKSNILEYFFNLLYRNIRNTKIIQQY
jgi:hypothetical protein